ncbi:recombinase family protein [Paraglaciecola sp.]|uniref:recombinase family protein n=1 Tax=Paraglaciecola sp. TaxID=1920173 RepID=UPI003264C3AB
MKVGFARVSIQEQDLQVQLSKLDAHGCEKIFQGKQSGASIKNDEKLKDLIGFIREGDEVIESIHNKGACLNIIDGPLNIVNDNPFSTAMINLCGVFAQLERDLIKARTAEGREEAKAKGKHMG